jgi:hypothetical protein
MVGVSSVEKKTLSEVDKLIIGVISAFALTCLAHVTLGWSWFLLFFDHPDSSEWANVVTTGVGIAAAALGLAWQANRARSAEVERARAAEVQRLHILSGMVAYLYISALSFRWTSERGLWNDHDKQAITRQTRLIEGIDPWSLPDWAVWHAAELIGQTGRTLLFHIDQVHRDPHVWSQASHDFLVPIFNLTENNISAALWGITQALRERGEKHRPLRYEFNNRRIKFTEEGDFEVIVDQE